MLRVTSGYILEHNVMSCRVFESVVMWMILRGVKFFIVGGDVWSGSQELEAWISGTGHGGRFL